MRRLIQTDRTRRTAHRSNILPSAILPFVLLVPARQAAGLAWDPAMSPTSGDGTGGNGTWLGAPVWSNGFIDLTWNNSAPQEADFGNHAGIVTLGGAVTATQGIGFDSDGYSITGASTDVLTLGGSVGVPIDQTATISANLAGAGFTVTGQGTLVLANTSNTSTGPVTLNNGILQANSASALSSAGIIFNGGLFQFPTTAPFDLSSLPMLFTRNATIATGTVPVTFANSITNAGAGSFIKSGLANLTLTANSTLNGQLESTEGSLIIDNATITANSGLYAQGGGNITIQDAAQIITHDSNAADAGGGITVKGTGTTWSVTDNGDGQGSVGLGNGSNSGVLTVQNGASVNIQHFLTVGAAGTGFLNVQSGGSLQSTNSVVNSAAVNLTGAGSSWTTSTLNIGSSPSSSVSGSGDVEISSGAAITVSGTTEIWNRGSDVTINAATLTTGLLVGTSNAGGIDLVADPSGGQALVINDNISTDSATYPGVINGAGSLAKNGVSTEILSGANTFNGTTQINGGIIQLGNRLALQKSTVTINLNNGLNLAGFSSATLGALAGTGNLNLGSTALTIGSNNASTSYSGALSGNGSITKSGSGTWTLTNTDNCTGATSIVAGSINLSSTATIPSSAISIGTSGTSSAALNFQASSNGLLSRTFTSLSLGSTGTLNVVNSGNQSNRTVILTPSLTFAGSLTSWVGKLDLANNDMIVQAGGAASLLNITSQIIQARNGASAPWTGSAGITSSAAALTPAATALAVELNDDGHGNPLLTTFDNQTVHDGDVLVKYTFVGDADLSGTINATDYTLIDNGFASNLTGWRNGDFNYDGLINGDDYTLIDNAFNTQGSTSFAGIGIPAEMIATDTSQIAQLPEPSISLLALAAVSLMEHGARRSRRRSICKSL